MNKRRNLRRIRNLRRLLFRALLTNERSLAERILIYPRALCQSYPLSPYSLIAPVFRALDKQLPDERATCRKKPFCNQGSANCPSKGSNIPVLFTSSLVSAN